MISTTTKVMADISATGSSVWRCTVTASDTGYNPVVMVQETKVFHVRRDAFAWGITIADSAMRLLEANRTHNVSKDTTK